MKLRNTIFIAESAEVGFIPALNRLLSQKLPVEVAYELGKLGRQISERQKDFEGARIAILEKYGEKNEKDGTWTILAKNQDKANEEFNKLANIQEEYEIEEKVKLPRKNLDMTGQDTLFLNPVIELEEDVTEKKDDKKK